MKVWLEQLNKCCKLSMELLEISKSQEQSLDELDIDKYIEETKEIERLLSRLNDFTDKMFSFKEMNQLDLTDKQRNEIKNLQEEINENIKTSIEKVKEQEKRVELLQGNKRKKLKNLNNKQAIKGTYSKKKKEELKNIDKNKGSKLDEKN